MSVLPVSDERLFAEPRPPLTPDDGDADEIEVAFSGTVRLDRTNEQHVALFNGLRLGRRLDCVVAAVVVAQPKRAKLDADGNLSDRVLRATLRAEDVTLVDPAE